MGLQARSSQRDSARQPVSKQFITLFCEPLIDWAILVSRQIGRISLTVGLRAALARP